MGLNTLKIQIIRPTGIFQLKGRMDSIDKTKEQWEIEMKATTSRGTTVTADEELLRACRREIIASVECARFICERHGRKYRYP